MASAGATIDLTLRVARDQLANAFAAIRPPGHHCGREGPQGFCLINNVAMAANVVRKRCPHIKKVLVVDWDVHHGNGTEEIFLNDPGEPGRQCVSSSILLLFFSRFAHLFHFVCAFISLITPHCQICAPPLSP